MDESAVRREQAEGYCDPAKPVWPADGEPVAGEPCGFAAGEAAERGGEEILRFEPEDVGPEIAVRSLFPQDYVFPPLEAMTPREISDKVDEIATIFAAHNIEFAFDDNLPDEVLYKYLVEDYIPNEMVRVSTGDDYRWFIDGCSGDCIGCFQREHCSTAADLLAEGDREPAEGASE